MGDPRGDPRRAEAFAQIIIGRRSPGPKILPFVNYAERSRKLHHQQAGRLTWIRAWKTAFANAPTKSGPHMTACTAKPISIGFRPNGKSWRHQRPRSPTNQLQKRSDGRLHVRRPPERSRRTSHPRCQRLFGGDQHVERLPRLGHVTDTGRDRGAFGMFSPAVLRRPASYFGR
jgi:hypothetical protein